MHVVQKAINGKNKKELTVNDLEFLETGFVNGPENVYEGLFKNLYIAKKARIDTSSINGSDAQVQRTVFGAHLRVFSKDTIGEYQKPSFLVRLLGHLTLFYHIKCLHVESLYVDNKLIS